MPPKKVNTNTMNSKSKQIKKNKSNAQKITQNIKNGIALIPSVIEFPKSTSTINLGQELYGNPNNGTGNLLEIHHINGGYGDALFIKIVDAQKNTNTTVRSILVDVGPYTSKDLTNPLISYLTKIESCTSNRLDIDCFIASHYHEDHIAGCENLNKSFTLRTKSYIDIGSYTIKDMKTSGGSLDGYMTFTNPYFDYEPKTIYSGCHMNFGEYKKFLKNSIEDNIAKAKKINIPVDVDGGTYKSCTIEIGKIQKKNGSSGVVSDEPVKLVCYAANGFVEGSNTRQFKGNLNDASIAFVLVCGNFKYYFGGDLSGDTRINGVYADLETPLGKLIGPVDCMKINHHGSAFSSNENFLNSLNASTMVVTVNNLHHVLPSEAFLRRVTKLNMLDRLRYTNNPVNEIKKYDDILPKYEADNTLDGKVNIIMNYLKGKYDALPPNIRTQFMGSYYYVIGKLKDIRNEYTPVFNEIQSGAYFGQATKTYNVFYQLDWAVKNDLPKLKQAEKDNKSLTLAESVKLDQLNFLVENKTLENYFNDTLSQAEAKMVVMDFVIPDEIEKICPKSTDLKDLTENFFDILMDLKRIHGIFRMKKIFKDNGVVLPPFNNIKGVIVKYPDTSGKKLFSAEYC